MIERARARVRAERSVYSSMSRKKKKNATLYGIYLSVPRTELGARVRAKYVIRIIGDIWSVQAARCARTLARQGLKH